MWEHEVAREHDGRSCWSTIAQGTIKKAKFAAIIVIIEIDRAAECARTILIVISMLATFCARAIPQYLIACVMLEFYHGELFYITIDGSSDSSEQHFINVKMGIVVRFVIADINGIATA